MQRLLIILVTIIALMPRIAIAQESKQESNAVDKALYYHNIAQNSENIDSVLHFALLSLQHGERDNYPLRASNFYLVGKSLYMQNKSKEALGFSLRALECNLKTGDKSETAKNYILIAKCYHDLNNKDSIFYYFDLALDIYTELRDTANLAYTYQSIGSVNVDLGFPQNARKYYLQALRIDSLSGNYLDLAFDYQNVAFIETELGVNQNALKYLNKAVRIFDTATTSDPYYIYIKYATYLGLTSTYLSYAKELNDKNYADSAYVYIKKIGDYFIENGIYSSQLYKSIYYARYLSFYNRDKEAVKILLQDKQYLEEEEGVVMQTIFYNQLSEAYEKLGDYKNAIANYKTMHEYSLLLTNDSTMNVIAEFKAEQESKIQQAENSRLEADKTKLQTITMALIGGLILAALLVFFIVKALKTKHRANEQLSEVNKKVYRSITYAERIQRAALTPQKEIDRLFPENFVFYQPRDILSGDFYYAAQCGRFNVLVTADCTGHGIPGAFLSILGISALKEFCVTESDAANPGTILDRMRIFVKTTLVSSSGSSIGEGMDMTICCFDTESMEMRYATANQTAYLIRRGEVHKLKGDTMPVGRYVVEKEHFTTYIQPLEKGDMIYCYSDGITDQPGGERINTDNRELSDITGRKFSSKSLINLLCANYYRPLETQYRLLDKTLTEWRNGRPLIDDMTLIGIKV
ncbi:MAG: SpoIIE family protein phosphatase [Bacteroidales bacterium]|nr:SpoIIE family protein phosphatase [Bacteroidales bacterium]